MVSHEVRTPLSVVSGAAGLLISSPHTPEQAELIDLVELGAQNVVSIINDMLHFGQLEFGEFQTTYEPINLVRGREAPSCLADACVWEAALSDADRQRASEGGHLLSLGRPHVLPRPAAEDGRRRRGLQNGACALLSCRRHAVPHARSRK